jgi:cell division protein FtsQ
VAGAAVAAVVAAIAVVRSPLLDVDRIVVTGAARTGPDAVVAASGVDRGDRMVGVPLGRVAERVRRLPWVATATVRRSWPSTVRIEVRERVAVAAAPAQGGGWILLDADRWEAGTAAEVPAHLARLEVPPVPRELGRRGPAGLDPLVAVAASVPAAVGDRLVSLQPGPQAPAVAGGGGGAAEVDGTVRLPDGSTVTVRFGPPDQLARKWLALVTLLDQVDLGQVATIDLRVPGAPATTLR